jgi:hypothetical protein
MAKRLINKKKGLICLLFIGAIHKPRELRHQALYRKMTEESNGLCDGAGKTHPFKIVSGEVEIG